MNVFETVKQSVTTRQAAEHYGIRVGRNGMACCPFHNDKTPSMKLDRRYHCFGCGADGDVIDFTAALYGLGKKEAAVQLVSDFGLSYEDRKPPDKRRKPKGKSPEILAIVILICNPNCNVITPSSKISAEPLLPCSCRLSPSAGTLENRVCAGVPGWGMASPVCGSLTENQPCGISAGHAAVRRYGGTGADYD